MNKGSDTPQYAAAAKSKAAKKKSAIRYAVVLLAAVMLLLLISYFSSVKAEDAESHSVGRAVHVAPYNA